MATDDASLGRTLRQLREIAGQTLKSVAEPSGICAAYLHKLEHGGVQSPSPRVLFALAETLGANYSELMRSAGYVVPGGVTECSVLTHSLNPKCLTEEEVVALIDYLGYLRKAKKGKPGDDAVKLRAFFRNVNKS